VFGMRPEAAGAVLAASGRISASQWRRCQSPDRAAGWGKRFADLRQDGITADRYRTADGWTVEVVQLAEGDRLRISHHGFYIADALSVDDLARWIPAAELAQLERDTLILAA
jgi:hypothetical protein